MLADVVLQEEGVYNGRTRLKISDDGVIEVPFDVQVGDIISVILAGTDRGGGFKVLQQFPLTRYARAFVHVVNCDYQ